MNWSWNCRSTTHKICLFVCSMVQGICIIYLSHLLSGELQHNIEKGSFWLENFNISGLLPQLCLACLNKEPNHERLCQHCDILCKCCHRPDNDKHCCVMWAFWRPCLDVSNVLDFGHFTKMYVNTKTPITTGITTHHLPWSHENKNSSMTEDNWP